MGRIAADSDCQDIQLVQHQILRLRGPRAVRSADNKLSKVLFHDFVRSTPELAVDELRPRGRVC